MIEIAVHPRALKHGLTKEEIKFAWNILFDRGIVNLLAAIR